jgi:hypothetical protein
MTICSLLSGCGHDVNRYAQENPRMSIKEFFSGNIKAWGIVQDWRGRVTRRFTVDMVGKWEGNKGTLTEHFDFSDGKTQERIWTITRISDTEYEGTAGDIIGKAEGETSGNAARWNYQMDLPVGDSSFVVRFDDWMWAIDENTVMNRSYIKKFGVQVAELTIFMQKTPDKAE